MSPEEIAEKVFKAIKEDKFYIISHPQWMMAAQARHEAILKEQNPTSMITDMLVAGQV